ncbi:MAG: IS4 family transposase, partial [Nannocystaceae bacterium]
TQIKKRYGRRFSIEEMFRDMKDLRFGMGLSWMKVRRPDRRDRLFLIATLAHALLTFLGAAGEELGFDRYLKTNTSKKRTLSLLRQGLRWYDLSLTMNQDRFVALMRRFDQLIHRQIFFREVLGAV